ncbi:MAG: PQQ-dependent sugar dehydrogenase [Chloroflexi bacterium]|nr:PQQ-dependent sugar dehydrogenase [Chloroflexota bacterium]
MLHLQRASGLLFLLFLLIAACAPAAVPTPTAKPAAPAATQPAPPVQSAPTSAPAAAAATSAPAASAARSTPERGRTATPTPEPPATPETKQYNTPTPVTQVAADITIRPVVEGVLVPMAMQFAPDGRVFFNEVSKGLVRIVKADGTLQEEPFVQLRVAQRKEMGALGLALHPDFARNHWVYVFYSQAKNDIGDPEDNRVVRYTEKDGLATERTPIIRDLPAGICCHNGGRLGFGRDGKLYVTVGDVNQDDRAQNPKRLNGKILRLNDDGSIPGDNPDPSSPVYATGFRNPYGLAFHPVSGVPYITENGEVGHDEVNRVVAGGNYGNPVAEGYAHQPGFIDPIWETERGRIAPSGATFYTGTAMPEYAGDFFFCSYNTGDLTRMRFGGPNFDQLLEQDVLAKICYLDVAAAPDGSLWIAGVTSILRFGR